MALAEDFTIQWLGGIEANRKTYFRSLLNIRKKVFPARFVRDFHETCLSLTLIKLLLNIGGVEQNPGPKGRTEQESKAWNRLYSAIAQLSKEFGQPVLLSFVNKYGLISYGGSNVVRKMNISSNCPCFCSCENSQKSWFDAHIEDILETGHGVQKLELPADDQMGYVISKYTSVIPKLPRKLEFMILNDLKAWLRNQFILDRLERGLTGTRVDVKDPLWKPSFWLPEWPWEEVTKSISDWGKTDYTGPNDLTWFCKELVKERLKQKNISNVDKYVLPSFTAKLQNKLERCRGHHIAASEDIKSNVFESNNIQQQQQKPDCKTKTTGHVRTTPTGSVFDKLKDFKLFGLCEPYKILLFLPFE
jgi:hypothetical protein